MLTHISNTNLYRLTDFVCVLWCTHLLDYQAPVIVMSAFMCYYGSEKNLFGLPGTNRALQSKLNLICSSSAAAWAQRSHKPWSCPPSSCQHTQSLKPSEQQNSQQMCPAGRSYSVQVGVGIGVQGGKGLCSPPLRSDKEYLMLVYSRPLILLFCGGPNDWGLRRKGGHLGGDFWCTPALPRYASAEFLCSAARPCRWTCTGLQSAPSQTAGNEPSGWSLAHRCRNPPLLDSMVNIRLITSLKQAVDV